MRKLEISDFILNIFSNRLFEIDFDKFKNQNIRSLSDCEIEAKFAGCSESVKYFCSGILSRNPHTIWSRHVSILAKWVTVDPIFPPKICSDRVRKTLNSDDEQRMALSSKLNANCQFLSTLSGSVSRSSWSLYIG